MCCSMETLSSLTMCCAISVPDGTTQKMNWSGCGSLQVSNHTMSTPAWTLHPRRLIVLYAIWTMTVLPSGERIMTEAGEERFRRPSFWGMSGCCGMVTWCTRSWPQCSLSLASQMPLVVGSEAHNMYFRSCVSTANTNCLLPTLTLGLMPLKFCRLRTPFFSRLVLSE